ncbi:uncharacterized protein C8Q71DRAFT_725027 [Rhodofomes roseus]|uniref:C2H2-type domain-containing protein n=1 Tax=Rhodofomes roseus TaxID=34475 RepID=A0ABQ8KAG8_9APHY|nr:uncharacterized protein C8Q71DRAFT_725027 [Rhodofomes roseus]KAH9834438.1 hypothetical protein C8Q71DRAFT_725027 [Rhodofomes roseus]
MSCGSISGSASSSSSNASPQLLDDATLYTTPDVEETESSEQLLEADELFFDFAKWEHDSTPEASSSGGESTPSLASTEEASAAPSDSPLSASGGLPSQSRPPSPGSSSAPSTSASPVRSKRKREASDEGPSTSVRQRARRAPRITPQAAPTPHQRRVYTCGLKAKDDDLHKCTWQGHSEGWWAHLREDEALKKLLPVKAETPRGAGASCGWDGCEFAGTAKEVEGHWKTAHKGSLADERTEDRAAGTNLNDYQVHCRACLAEGVRAVVTEPCLIRHLRTKHWGTGMKWCDGCGEWKRADTYSESFSSIRAAMITDLSETLG